jgi:hypothetical protein
MERSTWAPIVRMAYSRSLSADAVLDLNQALRKIGVRLRLAARGRRLNRTGRMYEPLELFVQGVDGGGSTYPLR